MLPTTSLFEPNAISALEARLNNLSATQLPTWGKMNAPEMLNHCASQMQIMLGDKTLKSNFLVRLFGKYIKNQMLAGKPLRKNSPTAKALRPTNVQTFEQEKANFQALMHRMKQNSVSLEGMKHPFMGKMTAEECAKVTWIHVNYHFGQFGI
jgi:Protein of unknown function (DUF1569)